MVTATFDGVCAILLLNSCGGSVHTVKYWAHKQATVCCLPTISTTDAFQRETKDVFPSSLWSS